MYPAKFEYVRANSVEEAVGLLEKAEGEGKILAGGHSLLPLMKLRLAQPRLLIDIGRVPGLKSVRVEGDAVVVGAMASYRDVAHSDAAQRLPVLAEAIDLIGDQQVRARGTVVGGLAHADPAGDMPAVALALGATLKAVGPNGTREISIDDFFVDMLTTSLGENEIVTEVRFPLLPAKTAAAYVKFDQPASHYALAGTCAVLTLNGQTIEKARIGITGVGAKAYRPSGVEQALAGQPATEDAVKAAVQTAPDGVDVQGDIHASPDYRAHLARVITRRAVLKAAERVSS